MAKIKNIRIENLKAIDFQQVNLEGCSIIVKGANRKGKTTLLRGIIDRIIGLRPSQAVKFGQDKGEGHLELTNGEKFKWSFSIEGEDKLTFVTADGHSERVTAAIAKKYFPAPFDIDEFIHAQPKDQLKQLAKLVKLDFTEIDAEYAEAYAKRTNLNAAELIAKVKFEDIVLIPEQVTPVKMDDLLLEKSKIRQSLNSEYEANKAHNDKLRIEFEALKDKARNEIELFNTEQKKKADAITDLQQILNELIYYGYEGKEVELFIARYPKPEALKEFKSEEFVQPAYIVELPDQADMVVIDEKIASATTTNEKAAAWTKYAEVKTDYEQAKAAADEADVVVKEIVKRKKEMIAAANLPAGIEFGEEGVLVDGYLLQDQNISTSQKYMAAIRLGALKLGEVESLHFDASTLDRRSLMEIEKWAASYPGIEGGIQLLIERPEFEGGEISYEIIEAH